MELPMIEDDNHSTGIVIWTDIVHITPFSFGTLPVG